MRGILSHGTHIPYWRLDRADIRAFFGSGGGKGQRAVASFDEDTTSMAVEASRAALRGQATVPDQVWFATAAPGYLDRTNATVLHAALRLPSASSALDMLGSQRSAIGALRNALAGQGNILVSSSDVRTSQPTGAEEAGGGDAAAALLIGEGSENEILASLIGSASTTAEFVDRWRAPGDAASRGWDDRFSEMQYVPLAQEAWKAALEDAKLSADQVDLGIVTGLHSRSVKRFGAKLGAKALAEEHLDDVGNSGAAHPGVLLSLALETAQPGQILALTVLADGAEVLIFRVEAGAAQKARSRSTADQIAEAGALPYAKFLTWRGMVAPEPPRRPPPDRPSSSAAARNAEWKFGFVGSRDRESGAIHLPPSRTSITDGNVDGMEAIPMSEARGTIVTFTIDRLAYSVNPPIVFAIVDFEGGGRAPIELTDVDPGEVAIGDTVEMTFRRLYTADGLHNYFWKGRPVRDASAGGRG